MGLFIAIAAIAAFATGLLVVLPMLRSTDTSMGREELDAALYRDQLAEVERDLERGTISAAEAEGARAEISRRLLTASAKAEAAEASRSAPRMSSGIAAGLCLLAVPLVGAGLYLATGSPGAPDLPFAERPTATRTADAGGGGGAPGGRLSQGEAEAMTPEQPAPEVDAEYVALIARLEARLEANPEDTQGLRLLANGLLRLQRWSEAWQAHDRLIQALGIENAEAELFASMAEAMVMAAGGYVSPEANSILGMALERNPSLPIARYYAGLSLAQSGMVPQAVEVWSELRTEAPPDAPWLPWLDQMLAQATEMQAGGAPGQSSGQSPAAGGPDADAVAAAEDMSPDERQEMIMGMVSGLESRLLEEGGTPEKWNQLINSYMFMEMRPDAQRIAGIARERLGGQALEVVESEIARLGLDGDVTPLAPVEPYAPVSRTPGATAGAPAEAAAGAAVRPGPTAEDIEAAGQMAPDDREQMILAMVGRLEDRLTSEGGDSEDWFMLLRSYANLGDMENASRVYGLSQEALKGQEAGFIKEQALLLGVPIQ